MTQTTESEILSVEAINNLAVRVQQAEMMRAEGKPADEIAAVEPSPEEMAAAINALRRNRISIETKKPRASTPRASKKASVDDLLGL